nr:MAG TPA: hypothetical protein [Caudoviricetes sp.]
MTILIQLNALNLLKILFNVTIWERQYHIFSR